MSTELQFDLLRFHQLSWQSFVRRYLAAIQPQVAWERLSPPRKMGLHLVQPGDRLRMVWYSGGDWRDGKPREAKLGTAPALARLPAVKLRQREFLVLDGCHRLSEVKPAFVVLDWIEPKRADRVYFTDLFNAHFKGGRGGRNR